MSIALIIVGLAVIFVILVLVQGDPDHPRVPAHRRVPTGTAVGDEGSGSRRL